MSTRIIFAVHICYRFADKGKFCSNIINLSEILPKPLGDH